MMESRLYELMRTPFYSAGWMVQRIETGSTCVGFPDLLLIHQGHTIYCELKTVNETKSGVIRPQWRPGQLGYLRKLSRHKCDVCLCIAVGERWYFSDPFEVRDINEIRAAHRMIVSAFQLPV